MENISENKEKIKKTITADIDKDYTYLYLCFDDKDVFSFAANFPYLAYAFALILNVIGRLKYLERKKEVFNKYLKMLIDDLNVILNEKE